MSAYVFARQGGQWIEQQRLTASDGATFDQFGIAVAISGATIVVGANEDAIGSIELQGSAYVFTRQGGQWVEQQQLTASDGAALDQFGTEVAISGARIVVGAVGDTTLPGSAYVFAP